MDFRGLPSSVGIREKRSTNVFSFPLYVPCMWNVPNSLNNVQNYCLCRFVGGGEE